ncbi:RNA-binding protein [Takifugu flavidus]|uniref:RNA-binding protein n=1 Tax=Takifugu flavidus TaxID=433684 RepID=A0A5C6P547_9TELE|nr:RNA-binding protein [Takifugu flavidus]
MMESHPPPPPPHPILYLPGLPDYGFYSAPSDQRGGPCSFADYGSLGPQAAQMLHSEHATSACNSPLQHLHSPDQFKNPGANPSRPGGFPGANSPGPVADLYAPGSQDSAVGNYISAASPQPGSGFGPSITVTLSNFKQRSITPARRAKVGTSQRRKENRLIRGGANGFKTRQCALICESYRTLSRRPRRESPGTQGSTAIVSSRRPPSLLRVVGLGGDRVASGSPGAPRIPDASTPEVMHVSEGATETKCQNALWVRRLHLHEENLYWIEIWCLWGPLDYSELTVMSQNPA